MSGKIKKMNFWVRRRSHLAVLVLGTVTIMLLFFNEDASWKKNMEYQQEIKELNERIAECRDSAEYFRQRREELLAGSDRLEQIAREKYHMQKPTEDVYILK